MQSLPEYNSLLTPNRRTSSGEIPRNRQNCLSTIVHTSIGKWTSLHIIDYLLLSTVIKLLNSEIATPSSPPTPSTKYISTCPPLTLPRYAFAISYFCFVFITH
ncbi:hypothetical protein CARUB_v10018298mg [Capsella rubella]|uniref:Uncharacterized protein n=1 Tax=Capsella rubella TaxID=81985 RepID=R0HDS3_9BRAS|nr:hypothetical protein CARUB_v10018298mg [Capsella rubella]